MNIFVAFKVWVFKGVAGQRPSFPSFRKMQLDVIPKTSVNIKPTMSASAPIIFV